MSDHSDTGGLDGSAARHAGHATHSQPSPRSSGHAAHDKHAGHDPEMFRRRFWLSLALTIPLVVTSHMVMDWFGYTLDLPLMEWYGPVLGSIVFWWGGWPFLVGGLTRGSCPPARDDVADLDGDQRRLRCITGDEPRLAATSSSGGNSARWSR